MYTAGYIVWFFWGSDEIMQVQWVFSMDSDLYPGLRKGCFAVCVNSSVVAMVIDTITMTTTSTGSISLLQPCIRCPCQAKEESSHH